MEMTLENRNPAPNTDKIIMQKAQKEVDFNEIVTVIESIGGLQTD